MVESQKSLAEAIDVIEETYEFSLAYAAQGRRHEEEDAGIRERLTRAEAALGIVASATLDAIPAAGPHPAAARAFLDVVKADAARTLLTDLFLLDEAVKISGI